MQENFACTIQFITTFKAGMVAHTCSSISETEAVGSGVRSCSKTGVLRSTRAKGDSVS